VGGRSQMSGHVSGMFTVNYNELYRLVVIFSTQAATVEGRSAPIAALETLPTVTGTWGTGQEKELACKVAVTPKGGMDGNIYLQARMQRALRTLLLHVFLQHAAHA